MLEWECTLSSGAFAEMVLCGAKRDCSLLAMQKTIEIKDDPELLISWTGQE